TANNTKDVSFAASLPIVSIPFSEGFISSTFPPANWILYNPDAGFTWSKKAGAGGFGNSTSCAKMDFLNSTEGNIDDLIIAPVDLSSATAFGMAFNVAYARYDATYSDQMQVQVSTNCGTIWTTVWDKQGTALATAPDAITSFTPTASQWRAETINLNSYIGQASVFVKFHAISGWGNNCYVDDINLAVDAGVGSIDGIVNNINVYPNPFSNNTNVEFSIAKTENASFGVYNLIGEKVLSIDETAYGAGTHTVTINANDLSQGIYYLNAIVGDQKFTQKLTIVK
ncbi:MAG: T9SS type A sorting domain-containing protein, partial [Bacteroidales bacterium]